MQQTTTPSTPPSFVRTLLRLSDTNLTIADPEQDVRGRKTIDSNGQEIGKVEDLFIDDTEKHVRFLELSAGGIFGIGSRKFLIPVDAIARIEKSAVYLDRTHEHIEGAPTYNPKVTDETARDQYFSDVYAYYGYLPYWASGYAYPIFPPYL
jgi:sporulation protein YlmC with PRC-barrel domain